MTDHTHDQEGYPTGLPADLPASMQVYADDDHRPQGICDDCGRVVRPINRGVQFDHQPTMPEAVIEISRLLRTRCQTCHQARA